MADSTPKNIDDLLNNLNEIAMQVMRAAEADSFESILEQIANVSRDMVEARFAALSVPDDNDGLHYFKVSGIPQKEIDRIDHFPKGMGLLGLLMEDGETLRLEDMATHPKTAGFCANHPYMKSLLAVPIQLGGEFFGRLYLCDRIDGEPFNERDQWVIETLAGYAALAIAGGRLSTQHSRMALLEERERIGMELHDGVIQSLYGMGMNLELLRTSDDFKTDDLKPTINNLNRIIEDIRDYIHDLKMRNYRQETIHGAIEKLITRRHLPDGVEITVDAPQTQPPFLPATFEALCQIANEALSNALRHAQASHVTISAHQDTDNFWIRITDDGKGFDLETLSDHEGLGLRNIRQRALMHNGSVEIESALGEGTRLTITIPIGLS